jgi:hypothetical protein
MKYLGDGPITKIARETIKVVTYWLVSNVFGLMWIATLCSHRRSRASKEELIRDK